MNVQTTESTGKRWKLLQAIGVLGILIGVTWWILAANLGGSGLWPMLLLVAGTPTYVIGRLGGWWYHG